MIRSAARIAPALAVALGLAGCITLFPKEQPSNLYRFGVGGPPSAPAAAGVQFTVLNDSVGFDRAAATDRILTATGNEVAYVKDARWAVPAPLMFREAVHRAFDAAGGPARLVERGESGHAEYVLKLDVRRFEARYENGAASAPTVVVRVRAALTKVDDGAVVGDRMFEASVPASDNRMGAIVEAFDHATSKTLGDVVTWVDQAKS